MISARHGKRSNVKPYRFLRPHFPSASCAVTASCAILSGKIVLGKKSNFPTGCCFCRLREREGEGGTEEAAHSQPARPPPRRIIYNLGHGQVAARSLRRTSTSYRGHGGAIWPRKTPIVSQYETSGLECTPHSCRNILEFNHPHPQCCNFLIKKARVS